MGETGCGKTKPIDFMSKLAIPTELVGKLTTMKTVKVSHAYLSVVYTGALPYLHNSALCIFVIIKLCTRFARNAHTMQTASSSE